MANWLKSAYLERIVPALLEEFTYNNLYQVPKISRIVVNCGLGDEARNARDLDVAMNDMALFAGQRPGRPVKAGAKNVVAHLKNRANQPLGLSVTLRGNVMWSFLDRLINLGLSRPTDFQAVSPNSFDGHGNYRVGINDQNVFPEVSELGYDSVSKQREMKVCIETTAPTDEEAYKLLALLGMPFAEGTGPAVSAMQKKQKSKSKSHHTDSKSKQKARR